LASEKVAAFLKPIDWVVAFVDVSLFRDESVLKFKQSFCIRPGTLRYECGHKFVQKRGIGCSCSKSLDRDGTLQLGTAEVQS